MTKQPFTLEQIAEIKQRPFVQPGWGEQPTVRLVTGERDALCALALANLKAQENLADIRAYLQRSASVAEDMHSRGVEGAWLVVMQLQKALAELDRLAHAEPRSAPKP